MKGVYNLVREQKHVLEQEKPTGSVPHVLLWDVTINN